MHRRLVVGCFVLVVIATAVIVAVKRHGASSPLGLASLPGVQVPPSKTPEVVVPTIAGSTAAVPPQVRACVPPAVSTPGLATVVDRRLPFDERVRGLASGEVTEVKDGRDLETLASLLGDPEEDDTVRHEIANLLSRSGHASLEACLVRIVENPAEKERFRSWAVQHLGNLLLDDKRPGDRRVLADRLRTLLTDRHIKVRREALLALARHDDATALEKVREVLSDTGPGADEMRDLAIRLAQDKKMREHIPLIRPYVRSTNEIIRIAAIVALGQWGDEFSRTAFEEAAQSDSVRLQRCGKAALTKLDAP